MNFRKFRGLTAVALAAALVLSGCGSSDKKGEESPSPTSTDNAAYATTTSPEDAAILKTIKVDFKDANVAPSKVDFKAPLGMKEAGAIVLSEGTGEVTEHGSIMRVNFLQFDGTTGEQKASTYEDENPQVIIQGDAQIYPQLMETLSGAKVGTRVAFATPSTEQAPSILFVMELSGVESSVPVGEEVAAVDGNPTVTFDDKGIPSVDIPKDFEVGSELQIIPLVKGEGPEVGDKALVTANYAGWKASNGEQFDSSFDRGLPFQFSSAGGVIQGWLDGVKGQTVGSRVLLVVPKELGYGGAAGHELENEDLIFVVDILAVEQ